MKQFSKCKILNHKLYSAKKSFNEYLEKELNEAFSVFAPNRDEGVDGYRKGINQLADNFIEKIREDLNRKDLSQIQNKKISIIFKKSQHQIIWLNQLEVIVNIQYGIYTNGAISPEDTRIEETDGTISATIEISLNPNDIDSQLKSIFKHELMHTFQIWNWRIFKERDNLPYQKYSPGEELNKLVKEYPGLYNLADFKNFQYGISIEIPIYIQLAYCIANIGYYLNPLEMQAHIQSVYQELDSGFELTNDGNLREQFKLVSSRARNELEKPLAYLNLFKKICESLTLFDNPSTNNIDKAVSNKIPKTIEYIFGLSLRTTTLFRSLNKVFRKRFSTYRAKMERMLKIFKEQISEFDKLLLSNKTVLFKRNNRSYQVSLEDMIYDKDYLPVY